MLNLLKKIFNLSIKVKSLLFIFLLILSIGSAESIIPNYVPSPYALRDLIDSATYIDQAPRNNIATPKYDQKQEKREIVAIAFDSSKHKAFREVFIYPFIEKTNIPASDNFLKQEIIRLPSNLPDYWQIVSVNREVLLNECHSKGKLSAIDWRYIPHKKQLNINALESCGVGYAVSATVLAYSEDKQYGTPPSSWEDLFDIDRYPGKRALPKQGRSNLEIALLSTGVPNNQLYAVLNTPSGMVKAINKLESIKDHIVWWDDIDQAKQWLIDGEVTMLVGPDGPILADHDETHPIGIMRNQVIYRMLYLALLKQADQKELAYSFLSFVTQLEPQLNFAKMIPYGLANHQANSIIIQMLNNKITNYPLNLKNAILENSYFYAKSGEKLEKLFNEWFKKNFMEI